MMAFQDNFRLWGDYLLRAVFKRGVDVAILKVLSPKYLAKTFAF
jgi:hypothetical protein